MKMGLDMELNVDRNYYFDNLKFMLITLVVIGHIIEPLIGSYVNVKLIYSFIYSFHMPLFVFISGYFCKNINENEKTFSKINNILIPYIIFQLLYSLFNIYVLKGQSAKITFVYPYWITWYLLSLFMWILILPYFSKIKYSIVIAIFISILSGYDNNIGYYLSLSRTITFFPYFLIGYFCSQSHINIIKKYIRKKYAILALIIIVCLIYFINDDFDYKWFYGSFSYSQLSTPIYPKFIMRIFTYMLAIITSVFVLALIPKCKLFFTKLGSRTTSVYALHGFIVKLLIKYDFFSYINSFTSKILIIIFSFFIVLVLSSKSINTATKKILHPKVLSQMGR